jgi:putative hydrolase of the HAD superfamily
MTRVKKPVFMFDMGNVLVDFSETGLVRILSEASGISFEEIWNTRFDEDLQAVETGLLAPEEYFERQVRVKVPAWEYEDLVQLWYDVFYINHRGAGLFNDLLENGCCAYILSNLAEFNKIAVERKYPEIFEKSTGNFFSYELGYVKPDAIIYRQAAERAGVLPENCVFLDDRIENIEGAQKAGWNAFHYTPETADSVEREIRRLAGI